jgi:Flp pilus assembly protein TadG
MKRFFRNRTGGASLELCLVMPFLVVMYIAIFDFGFLLYFQSQVETAADAGALYAAKQGISKYNANKIASATTGASYPVTVTTPTNPYMACGCPNGTTGLTVSTNPAAPACGGACAGGGTSVAYVVVTAQANTISIFNWFGAFPQNVNSAVVMRLPP